MNPFRQATPLVLSTVFAALPCYSQAPPTAPPTTPPVAPTAAAPVTPKIILSPAPDKVSWNVRFTYKKAPVPAEAAAGQDLAATALQPTDFSRPSKIEYVIKAPVSSAITTFEDGGKEMAYYFGNYEFKKTRRSKDVYMQDLDSYPMPDQLFRKRFPGVHWVNPKLFVRVEVAYGESCAYFREGAKARPKDSDSMEMVMDSSIYSVREAWFSMATGLPVAYKTDMLTAQFKFEAPPTEPVVVPPDIKESINKQARYLAYINQTTNPAPAPKKP